MPREFRVIFDRLKNKQSLFFGAVWTGKSYVRYSLVAVYTHPGLLW